MLSRSESALSRTSPVPVEKLQHAYRTRIIAFLIAVLLCLAAFNALYKGINTIRYLDVVESERDGWQRPDAVIAALDIKAGSTVAEIGSGAGYFSLKLSRSVGPSGRVIAEDIQRFPLLFLWIRSSSRAEHNLTVRVGDGDDPRLPKGALDAVLIANTYHEFANPATILHRVREALSTGGRLVVLDRGTLSEIPEQHSHELSPGVVANQMGENGFQIIQRDDRFILHGGGEQWWLIVAQKTGY